MFLKTLRAHAMRHYHAELNADQLPADLLVFLQVSLDRTTPDIFASFTEANTIGPGAKVPYDGGWI